MKKYILAAFAALATLNASAVVHWETQSFFGAGVASITVSNTYAVTNLASTLRAGGATNDTGIIVTNLNNKRIIIGVTTNFDGSFPFAAANLIGDVPVSPLSVPVVGIWSNATTEAGSGFLSYQGNMSLDVTLVGGSGNNTAATLRFIPLYDGVNPSTAAAEVFSWGVTVNTTTAVSLKTNINLMTRWNNARAIRCEVVMSGDTDASSQLTVKALGMTQLWP